MRLNSAGSDQEQDGLNASASNAERKKTLEERMNEMVDAVFGQPKHELLKFIQRSPPSSNAVPSCVAVDELVQSHHPSTTADLSAIIDIDSHTRHDFQETNSFRPCTCAHCNGLVKIGQSYYQLPNVISLNLINLFTNNFKLWGPLRQGYKCRECGLTAHKMCKDVMNVTCRPKSLITSPFTGIHIYL